MATGVKCVINLWAPVNQGSLRFFCFLWWHSHKVRIQNTNQNIPIPELITTPNQGCWCWCLNVWSTYYPGVSSVFSYDTATQWRYRTSTRIYQSQSLSPAPITQLVECPLRGKGGHGFDPGPRHTKVVKNGTSCSSLGTQTYGVELGLVDPVSG